MNRFMKIFIFCFFLSAGALMTSTTVKEKIHSLMTEYIFTKTTNTEIGIVKELKVSPELMFGLKIEKTALNSNKILIISSLKNISNKEIRIEPISTCSDPIITLDDINSLLSYFKISGHVGGCPFVAGIVNLKPNAIVTQQYTLTPKFNLKNKDIRIIAKTTWKNEIIKINFDVTKFK